MNKFLTNKFAFLVICAAFIFAAGTNVNAQRTRKPAAVKTQNARVEVVAGGYQPEELKLKKGVPARVTFVRKTEDECGEEVVFPDYNIRRKLPLNKPVIVAFTPRKSGSFNFACGMDMMRGKVIVQ